MLSSSLIILVASIYLGGLFLLAFYSDRRAKKGGSSFVNSSVVYTLSLAVYCTSWTFYGAVGSAARSGLEFLTIYLGPTLVLVAWSFGLRKLVRISKSQRITSIADFISARYGKSVSISALVTIIAVIGVTPYIALQLQAVATSFDTLGAFNTLDTVGARRPSFVADTGFWVAVCMAVFVILFGTRNLGADERHPGIVAAIAFESIVKLLSLGAIAFLATYGLHDGLRDLFVQASANADVHKLYGFSEGFEPRWVVLTFLSAAAIICLPRQFQVAVVENVEERHVATASWLFPLYLMLVSMFVVPIAISGMTQLPASMNPDLYVLAVPLASGHETLALLAFIGGLSAATSMVIVASIALAIMISNHLVMPVILRFHFFSTHDSGDFSATLLLVRRLSIIAILSLGFTYYRLIGTSSPLASIGLISFVGIAQFLPALLGGIFWSGGTKKGALVGLATGFLLWVYTLLVPSFAGSGWAFMDVVEHGPWSIAFLKPDALFGFVGWDLIVHGVFWSMTVNTGLYVAVSLATRQSPIERLQSAVFVDALKDSKQVFEGALIRSVTIDDLYQLARRFLGEPRAHRLFEDFARQQGRTDELPSPDPALIAQVERELASNVGAASARSLISRIVKGETISLDTVINILDETQQAIRYSRELERKSKELEDTAAELRRANAQLTTLDKLKDDFLSRVSHELRTPMTSIRSFSEILVDQPDLETEQASRFLTIIQQESMRLTRLLDEILELGRLENDEIDWQLEDVDAVDAVRTAVETMRGLAQNNGVTLIDEMGEKPVMVKANSDRLKQVFINLLSNAIKFNDSPARKTWITLSNGTNTGWEIHVRDNGPGISAPDREGLFSKFSRGWDEHAGRHGGSGLGLAISKQIMKRLGGDLVLQPDAGDGACFTVRLPAV